MAYKWLLAVAMLGSTAASAGTLDLLQWQKEGAAANGTWIVSDQLFRTNPDDLSEGEFLGTSVQQSINGRPTVFLNNVAGIAAEFSINAAVRTTSDDDFFGFVIGFQPGDFSNTAADYLLIDWKQGSQTLTDGNGQFLAGAPRGLSLSRVRGTPTEPEFWGKTDADPTDAGGVTQLARGLARGNIGWADNVPYRFDFRYVTDPATPGAARLQLSVCQNSLCAQEFDYGLDEAVYGNIGFYTYSQAQVEYSFDYPPLEPFTLPTYIGQAGTAVAPVPVASSSVFLLGGVMVLAGLRRTRRRAV